MNFIKKLSVREANSEMGGHHRLLDANTGWEWALP
jgi:hypothetical protein